tara:strand:- start:264 stop:488 length:225 start_codon:yes stop_codon:yes gene_type:complete
MSEINKDDLISMAGDNVYDTEYSTKITISCKGTTIKMIKELKEELNRIGLKVNNAQLLEYMVVELYNTNLNSYK